MWLIDIGYYKILSKFTCALSDSGSSRAFSFQVINFFKDLFVQFILCTVFLYWFSRSLRNRLIQSCILLIVGAFTADFYFYLKYSDEFFSSLLSDTIFWDGIIVNYLFNISLWGLVFCGIDYFGQLYQEQAGKKGIESITSACSGTRNSIALNSLSSVGHRSPSRRAPKAGR